MKIQSEFYFEELIQIMRGITLQLDENRRNINRANCRHTIMTILMPWKKRELGEQLYQYAMQSLSFTNLLKGIADKVMASEGRNENGEFVTMEEMLAKLQED